MSAVPVTHQGQYDAGNNQMKSSRPAMMRMLMRITEATLRGIYFLTVAQTTPYYDRVKRQAHAS